MQLDVVNSSNEKVGTVDVNDTVFGGRINEGLIWESVVRANAAERQGTHATKNRANVSGSGKKPWRQKGTGRARVGEVRNPLWRKGGTVFGPQPRSYEYQLPRKVEKGALRPLPYRSFPASRIDSAFRLISSGKHIGKVVVAFPTPFVPRRGELPGPGFEVKSDGCYLITGAFGGYGKVLLHLARSVPQPAACGPTGCARTMPDRFNDPWI